MGDSAEIIEFLLKANKTIAIVESCTGGLLNYAFGKVSGASSVYRGGIISYQNAIKSEVLGVDREILEAKSAYSFEVLDLMLAGVLSVMQSDFAIATSGVAGPSGGTEDNPVGSVFIGVRQVGYKSVMKKVHFGGSRTEIQRKAVKFALRLFSETFIKSQNR